MTALTDRELEVRCAALKKANDARTRRAKIKANCRAVTKVEGMGIVADVIEANDPLVGSWRLFDVLSLPVRMQERRVRELLREVGASDRRRLGELSDRQRERVVRLLRCAAPVGSGRERVKVCAGELKRAASVGRNYQRLGS